MTGPPPLKHEYSREEACRVVSISERQLRSWEKQKLVPESAWFGFKDLVALRTLAKLRKQNLRADRLRRVIGAVRDRLREIDDPLTELKVFSDGKRIGVQIAGHKMEPITGQLLLDFDSDELSNLLAFPSRKPDDEQIRERRQRKQSAERWFQKGLELEQVGAPFEEVVYAYRQAAELDEHSAGALVNLGTLYFNIHNWGEAEKHYKQALKADPNYPLAYFNLGNLYDERGDRARALSHYLAAVRLHPHYGDAHYNLALLYQVSGQVMKAVQHWRIYLKLDPGSSWAVIARRELDKLRKATLIQGKR